MSERQQLALIKKLEKEAAEQATTSTSPTSSSTTVSSNSNPKLASGTVYGRTILLINKICLQILATGK